MLGIENSGLREEAPFPRASSDRSGVSWEAAPVALVFRTVVGKCHLLPRPTYLLLPLAFSLDGLALQPIQERQKSHVPSIVS